MNKSNLIAGTLIGLTGAISGTISFIIGKQKGKAKEKENNEKNLQDFTNLYNMHKKGAIEERKMCEELIKIEEEKAEPNENYINELKSSRFFWNTAERDYDSTIEDVQYYFTRQ